MGNWPVSTGMELPKIRVGNEMYRNLRGTERGKGIGDGEEETE